LLLGNRAFARVLDRNTFRSSNTHPGPPMTLGNMRELSLQTEFEKGNDHHGKYREHCRFEPK